MKAQFFLLPAAALTIAVPVKAAVYLTVEQAQAALFPGETFTQDFRALTPAQADAIESAADVNVRDKEIKAWKTSSGGWFILDEVVGKHDFIPIALAIDAKGAVKGVEILEYREAYGDQVRNPDWRAQFVGKTRTSKLQLTKDIENISGATLSCRHITDGVKRLLATHALVLAGG
jgi:hypothetical protein